MSKNTRKITAAPFIFSVILLFFLYIVQYTFSSNVFATEQYNCDEVETYVESGINEYDQCPSETPTNIPTESPTETPTETPTVTIDPCNTNLVATDNILEDRIPCESPTPSPTPETPNNTSTPTQGPTSTPGPTATPDPNNPTPTPENKKTGDVLGAKTLANTGSFDETASNILFIIGALLFALSVRRYAKEQKA